MNNYNEENESFIIENMRKEIKAQNKAEKDFFMSTKTRFNEVRNTLNKDSDVSCMIIYPQTENSSYLIREINKLDNNIEINSNWKGRTKNWKFNSFTITLFKYFRIENNRTDRFVYIEMHNFEEIKCIMCLEDKLLSFLEEKGYDKRSIKEQIEAGSKILVPEIVEDNLITDWRQSPIFENGKIVTVEEINILLEASPFLIFSVLAYSVFAALSDEIIITTDDNDKYNYKFLIPNFIVNDETKEQVIQLFNSCFIHTCSTDLWEVPYIEVSKKNEIMNYSYNYRPYIISYNQKDDALLQENLHKYYSYLSTTRHVVFPYKGVPVILSLRNLSRNYFTIDTTKNKFELTPQICEIVRKLFHNIIKDYLLEKTLDDFSKSNNIRSLIDNDPYKVNIDMIMNYIAKYKGMSKDLFTSETYTRAALAKYSFYILMKSLNNSKIAKDILVIILKVFFAKKTNYNQQSNSQHTENFTGPNWIKYKNFFMIINKINEMLDKNEIIHFNKYNDISIKDFDNLLFTVNSGNTIRLHIGISDFTKIANQLGLTKYSFEDFKSDAKKTSYSKCENKRKNLKVVVLGEEKRLLTFILDNDMKKIICSE